MADDRQHPVQNNRAGGVGLVDIRKHYAEDGLFSIHGPRFRTDQRFRSAYNRGVTASLGVDPHFEWRVHIALWAATKALSVPGDFVECGVNAGFISSAIMSYLDWSSCQRTFFLLDTFAGPVIQQFSSDEIARGRLKIAQEALEVGAYVTDLERVRINFSEWKNATVVQGDIPDVLASLTLPSVAFLHIDMNCATPESAALEFFWPRLSPGAIVLLDDYGYFGHECQAEALDHLAQRLGAEILVLPTGQGLLVR